MAVIIPEMYHDHVGHQYSTCKYIAISNQALYPIFLLVANTGHDAFASYREDAGSTLNRV